MISQSEISNMTQNLSKSMCRGDSKKEVEINMMMNLVESFLEKFNSK